MSTSEKYIGEALLENKPKKPINFILKDSAVTTDKLADGAITDTKLSEGCVTTEKITDGAITEKEIEPEFLELITRTTVYPITEEEINKICE